jgi:hypothetical protein
LLSGNDEKIPAHHSLFVQALNFQQPVIFKTRKEYDTIRKYATQEKPKKCFLLMKGKHGV